LPGNGRNAEGNRHDHGTVTEREQGAAIARQPWIAVGVVAGKAIDGGQMVGIETVLHAEHKGQDKK
jgi:hypothetical protein